MIRCRLNAAIEATTSAGAALLELRGKTTHQVEAAHGQLKTPVDRAAEGWVLGYIRALFAHDIFLCEESFSETGTWTRAGTFWTVDALDGTRSYVDGFDGFCVQVAFIEGGEVVVGVVREPVARTTYWAVKGQGAFVRRDDDGAEQRLSLGPIREWPAVPRFVDSSPPKGMVGRLMAHTNGVLVECGSFGLKMCRVAESRADLFAKNVRTALWDVAPGCLIVQEANCRAGRWDGAPIRFAGSEVYMDDLLVAPDGLFQLASSALAAPPSILR